LSNAAASAPNRLPTAGVVGRRGGGFIKPRALCACLLEIPYS